MRRTPGWVNPRLSSIALQTFDVNIFTREDICVLCGAMVSPRDGLRHAGLSREDFRTWREMHVDFHNQNITREEASFYMSDVKWCDKGDHPFRADEEGSQQQVITETVTDEKGNKFSVQKARDVCAADAGGTIAAKVAAPSNLMIEPAAPTHVELGERDLIALPVGSVVVDPEGNEFVKYNPVRFIGPSGLTISTASLFDIGPILRK